MTGFNFERNLPHQVEAIKSVLKIFTKTYINKLADKTIANIANPLVKFEKDLQLMQKQNKQITNIPKKNNICLLYTSDAADEVSPV